MNASANIFGKATEAWSKARLGPEAQCCLNQGLRFLLSLCSPCELFARRPISPWSNKAARAHTQVYMLPHTRREVREHFSLGQGWHMLISVARGQECSDLLRLGQVSLN